MITKRALALSIGSLLLLSSVAVAHDKPAEAKKEETHSHLHDHSHGSKDVYNGYFEDSAVKPRALSDWEGEWQSVYPYLLDGTLDPVMEHKAEGGGKSAKEFRDYYDIGYKTEVNRISIGAEDVTFYRNDTSTKAKYTSDGFEILTYEKGNRGVRYIFRKTTGDEAAPQYIQFSDHTIAPEKAGHYHLYWGDDRNAVLKELTNWPTYYPSSLSGKQIVHEMLEH